jgi:hypothetical protein
MLLDVGLGHLSPYLVNFKPFLYLDSGTNEDIIYPSYSPRIEHSRHIKQAYNSAMATSSLVPKWFRTQTYYKLLVAKTSYSLFKCQTH